MKRGFPLIFSLLAFLLVLTFLPVSFDVRKGLAILVFAAILWITEGLPLAVTSLSIPVLAVVLGIFDVKTAFSSFSHPIIFLFLGGFVLAAALTKYGLDKLIAFKIVSLSKGSPFTASVLLFLSTAFISMWISNTSTTVMMLPLALGIATALSGDKRLRSFLLLGVAYSASIGGIGTLVGSPPNGITAANLGMEFSDWLKAAFPVVIFLFPFLIAILYIYFKPKMKSKVEIEKVSFTMTKEKFTVLTIFSMTVILWLFSKKISSILGVSKYFDAVIAIFAVVLLFSFKLLTWEDVNKNTDWGTLLLFGGGLSLSQVLKATGTSKFIASLLVNSVTNLPPFFLVFSIVLFMIFLTELMSNTATAAIFIPILITAAKSLGLPPPFLALPAGIAASCAFMFPVATPPNAIVYGTGNVGQRDMLRVGLVLNVFFAFLITLYATFIL
ncbi:MAG: DASS family sodium-coupled anion symporter [Desulfurobacteriaceae bacterium]